MDKNNFSSYIAMLSNQAMASLRAKKCLPLPIHYQHEFNHLLESSTSEDLICHLHKEDMNIEETDDQKYLAIAKLALDSFIANHNLTETIMSSHHKRLTLSGNYDEAYLKKNCHKVVDSLSILDSEMTQMLIESQEQIHKLQTQLNQTLKESLTDPLTKFYNRKALFQDLVALTGTPHKEREVDPDRRVANQKLECYVLMIDLDNFKYINDTYGHVAGDKTLIFVARAILSIIRESDKAYRYGGDEVVVILNHSTLENVKIIAEKIRSTVEKAHLLYDIHSISLTLSIGISLLCHDGFESTIIKADEALYHAKQNGKNKVHVLTTSSP